MEIVMAANGRMNINDFIDFLNSSSAYALDSLARSSIVEIINNTNTDTNITAKSDIELLAKIQYLKQKLPKNNEDTIQKIESIERKVESDIRQHLIDSHFKNIKEIISNSERKWNKVPGSNTQKITRDMENYNVHDIDKTIQSIKDASKHNRGDYPKIHSEITTLESEMHNTHINLDKEMDRLYKQVNEQRQIASIAEQEKKGSKTKKRNKSPERPWSWTLEDQRKAEEQVQISKKDEHNLTNHSSNELSPSSSSSSSSSYNDQQSKNSESESEEPTESATATEWETDTDVGLDTEDEEVDAELRQIKEQSFKKTDKITYPEFKFLSSKAQAQVQHSLTGHSIDKYEPPEFKPISKSNDTQKTLQEITQNMRRFEAKKHSGPWQYRRIDATENTDEKNIIIIDYFPAEKTKGQAKLHQRHMKQKEKYSNAIRKLSILSGVLTMIDYDDYLTNDSDEKEEIKKIIIDMARKVSEEADEITELDSRGKGKANEKRKKVKTVEEFTKSLTEKVEKNCPENRNVTREIREAERYFTAEYNKNQVTIGLTHKKDEIIGQAAVNLNHSRMTPRQKESYIAIHNKDENKQPQWFKQLTKPQQQWYLERVPEPLDSPDKSPDWTKFESLFKPSATQDTPGTANARGETGFVVIIDDELDVQKSVIISESNKTASPVPYEMPLGDRELHTKLNVEQTFDIAQQSASESFGELWGEFFVKNPTYKPKDFKVPILMNSLLSKEVVGMDADSKLIQAQQAGFQEAKINQQASNYQWLYKNHGTNVLTAAKGKTADAHKLTDIQNTAHSFLSAFIPQNLQSQLNRQLAPHPSNDDKQSREDHKKLCDQIIASIDDNSDLNDEQKLALKTLTISIFKLRETEGYKAGFTGLSRNRSEYILAVEKQMVEAMGGVTINNCKSGKDRTGASAIYQNAMALIAYENEGQIPSIYHESDLEKKLNSEDIVLANQLLNDFYKTSAILHCSNFSDEKAAENTGGSNGLKLEYAGIVEDGISDQKNLSAISDYKQRMAATNKPSLFVDDEEYKAQLIAEADICQQKINKLKDNPKSDQKEITANEEKLENLLTRLRNQEKKQSITSNITGRIRKNLPKKSTEKKSKTSPSKKITSKSDINKGQIKDLKIENIDKDLKTFMDLCVSLPSDYKFINHPPVRVIQKLDELETKQTNISDLTRSQTVALIIKLMATPNDPESKFGHTKAIKAFKKKYNANNNEIPPNIKKDIEDTLQIKPGDLKTRDIEKKFSQLENVKISTIQYDEPIKQHGVK